MGLLGEPHELVCAVHVHGVPACWSSEFLPSPHPRTAPGPEPARPIPAAPGGNGQAWTAVVLRVWEWGVAPQLSLSHRAVISERKLSSMCCHSPPPPPSWEQPVGAGVNGGPPGTPRSCRWVFLLPTAPLSTQSISPGLCSHCGRRAGCTGPSPELFLSLSVLLQRSCQWTGGSGGGG